MFQQWREVLFLHWEYPVAAIQATLPEGLFVDTFDGKAYLGIVPFFMRNVRPRFLPIVPALSHFMELNLRTYVHDRAGVPGVWFYSLDANQWLAVEIARRFFHLPYEHAEMESRRTESGALRYQSKRLGGGAQSECVFEYAAGAAVAGGDAWVAGVFPDRALSPLRIRARQAPTRRGFSSTVFSLPRGGHRMG